MRRGISTLLAVLLVAFAAAAAYLNQQMITLDLWFSRINIPVWILIAGAVLIGMLAAILFTLGSSQKTHARLSEQESSMEEMKRSKEQAIKDAKVDAEAETMRQKAEIDGLNQRVHTLEGELRDSLAKKVERRGVMEGETSTKESGNEREPDFPANDTTPQQDPSQVHTRTERRTIRETGATKAVVTPDTDPRSEEEINTME